MAAGMSVVAPSAPRRERACASLPRPPTQFRLGEDVVHAAFGEGVVTGVEPGGVIVVRFAGDGSERKLMAEYAPRQPDAEAHVLRRAQTHSICGMSATIIDGKAIAARVRARGRARGGGVHARSHGHAPGLATVLVGEDPASAVYVGGKQRACARWGWCPFDRRLPAEASFEQVAEELERLERRPGGQRRAAAAAACRSTSTGRR